MKKRQSDGSEASVPSILEDSGKANGTFTPGFNMSPLHGNSKGRVTKTLVVHPSDPNTSRLKGIYAGIPSLTVKTGEVSNRKMIELIETHDRILLIGNGDPGGLFANGRFSHSFWVIDDTHAELLRKKADMGSMLVWPGADIYAIRNGLDLIATGEFTFEGIDYGIVDDHARKVKDEISIMKTCRKLAKSFAYSDPRSMEKIGLESGRNTPDISLITRSIGSKNVSAGKWMRA
jgi:hypothetical protein